MPAIGEIKKGIEAGYKDRNRYMWLSCPKCGQERWIKLSTLHMPCLPPLCKNCATHGGKNWKGGVTFDSSNGRMKVFVPKDSPYRPMANEDGYIFNYRLVMAQHLGRCLSPKEHVHHEDGNPLNDDISNLRLFPSNSEHVTYHKHIVEVKA